MSERPERPRLVFATYSRLWPVAQIGVLKRCLRLIPHLPPGVEIHLVNFGPLPEADPLVQEVCPRLTLHLNLHDAGEGELTAFLRHLSPHAVVLGEAPLAGSMERLSRAAAGLGLPQVGIENHYGAFTFDHLRQHWPQVAGWLTLGLTPRGEATTPRPGEEVAPPLVRPPAHPPPRREGLCLLGYDEQTLLCGIRLVGRLPADVPLKVFTTPAELARLSRYDVERARPGTALRGLPHEDELYAALASSKVVLCKNGYQQIVEALCFGARVVCRVAPGGVLPELIDPAWRPYLRAVSDRTDLAALALDVALWCADEAPTPWASYLDAPIAPIPLAAQRLVHLLTRAVGGERAA